MQISRKFSVSGLIAALLLSAAAPGVAGPAAAAPSTMAPSSPGAEPAAAVRSGPGPAITSPADGTSGRSLTVTLLTGDRVTVVSPTATTGSVRPGPGREGSRFIVERDRGHLYVIPLDAHRLVVTGRLDRRLFDVTTLIQYGYHDAARDTLPLIITHRAGASAETVAALTAGAHARAVRALPAIDATAETRPNSRRVPAGQVSGTR